MSESPNWAAKISNYIERLNLTHEISDEDFDYDFDDDFDAEFEDEWDTMEEYIPDIPLPVE